MELVGDLSKAAVALRSRLVAETPVERLFCPNQRLQSHGTDKAAMSKLVWRETAEAMQADSACPRGAE
jgi:hypothetical protein